MNDPLNMIPKVAVLHQSPVPWVADHYPDGLSCIKDSKGTCVACNIQKYDADVIVEAVNQMCERLLGDK